MFQFLKNLPRSNGIEARKEIFLIFKAYDGMWKFPHAKMKVFNLSSE